MVPDWRGFSQPPRPPSATISHWFSYLCRSRRFCAPGPGFPFEGALALFHHLVNTQVCCCFRQARSSEGGALAPSCYGNGRAGIYDPLPVLCNLNFPMNLFGSHWGWGHICSLRTVQVGKSKFYRMQKLLICQEIKKSDWERGN